MTLMTQADYARHRGVSRAAISKLIRSGKIPVEVKGKRKLINPADADFALDEHRERINSASPAPSEDALAAGGRLTQARTETEIYKARIAQLEYEARVGQLLRTADVTRAMEICAEAIVRDIDQLPNFAEDLAAAISKKGVAGARTELKKLAHRLRTSISDNMKLLGADEADTQEEAA